jgi:hypothetical protein
LDIAATAVTADRQHLDLRAAFRQSRGRFETIHAGHREIHHNDVGPDSATLRQRRRTIAGFGHHFHIGLGVEQRLEPLAHRRVVVRYKDAQERPPFDRLIHRGALRARLWECHLTYALLVHVPGHALAHRGNARRQPDQHPPWV